MEGETPPLQKGSFMRKQAIQKLRRERSYFEREMLKLYDRCMELESKTYLADDHIDTLRQMLAEKDRDIEKLRKEVESLTLDKKSLQGYLRDKDEEKKGLVTELARKHAALQNAVGQLEIIKKHRKERNDGK